MVLLFVVVLISTLPPAVLPAPMPAVVKAPSGQVRRRVR